MRRLHLLVLAVLACALVAVPAAQARVETKAVAQDKAAVQKYWTAKRMRNAIPADKALNGAGEVTSAAPGAEARARAADPAAVHVRRRRARTARSSSRTAGSNYVCSGTAVLAGNKSTVWTAGHCVHDGASGFHTNWSFVPAYADGSAPYGEWTARNLLTTSGWANGGDFSYDNGAAVVNTNGWPR